MDSQLIKKMLDILQNIFELPKYQEDLEIITNLSNKIRDLQNNPDFITVNNLDEMYKQIQYLDMKYDDVFDLVNLYDPIYIFLKKELHRKEVKKIRERNRKKRDKTK